VLMFERIREEIRAGKPPAAGRRLGLRQGLPDHPDSHVTTLITAAMLFMFGTGPSRDSP